MSSNFHRYYWLLEIPLERLQAINWRYGLKGRVVRLLSLRRQMQKQHQVTDCHSKFENLITAVVHPNTWSSSWVVLSQAVKKGKQEDFDVVLCDTSGRKFWFYSLFPDAPHFVQGLDTTLLKVKSHTCNWQVCTLITVLWKNWLRARNQLEKLFPVLPMLAFPCQFHGLLCAFVMYITNLMSLSL